MSPQPPPPTRGLTIAMERSPSWELGCPLPLDEHAVSVSLPTWRSVVGYEEGDAGVLAAMRIGYPRYRPWLYSPPPPPVSALRRFKVHAAVETLCAEVLRRHLATRRPPPGHSSFSWGLGLSCSHSSSRAPAGHCAFSWSAVESSGRGLGCMVLPSLPVARRLRAFLAAGPESHRDTAILALDGGLQAVVFSAAAARKAKAFWQHTGEIISSRQADEALRRLGVGLPSVTPRFCSQGLRHAAFDDASPASEAELLVWRRVAGIVGEPEGNVVLTVSGMAAIFAALRLAQALDKERGLVDRLAVVFGFPYIDTLKLCQRPELNPGGCLFLGNGDDNDLDALEQGLRRGELSVSVLFTEIPSNPLLRTPDLRRLSALAATFDFLLVVDDTVASCANLDLAHAEGIIVDAVCSSLTKAFSGRGDVMAGSLLLCSRGRHWARLLALVPSLQLPPLFPADAEALELNSRDFLTRSARINASALALAQWFAGLGSRWVRDVRYPLFGDEAQLRNFVDVSKRNAEVSYPDTVLHRLSLSAQGAPVGFGCLISVTLAAEVDPPLFYDSLALCKGPSLGTNFTLVCPYTLLAHYNELAWAESFGVSAQLIRISVGLEEVRLLVDAFSAALNAASPPDLQLPRSLDARSADPGIV